MSEQQPREHLTFAEHIARGQHRRKQRIKSGWGRWRFDPKADCLWYADPDQDDLGEADAYWVDLARCRSRDELFDWILHLSEKVWISSADLGDFIRAVDDLEDLRSVQRR